MALVPGTQTPPDGGCSGSSTTSSDGHAQLRGGDSSYYDA
jgi:hypothetical protein